MSSSPRSQMPHGESRGVPDPGAEERLADQGIRRRGLGDEELTEAADHLAATVRGQDPPGQGSAEHLAEA